MKAYPEVSQKEIEYVEELANPSQELRGDQRRYPRTPFRARCRLEIGSNRRPTRYRSQSIDISEKGIALVVEGRMPHPAPAPVRLRFDRLPETHGTRASRGVIEGTLVRTETSPEGETTCAVRFDAPLTAQIQQANRSRLWTSAILVMATIVLLAIAGAKYLNYRWFWYDPAFQIYSLSVAVFILSRVIMSLFYKMPKDRGYHPSLSMIIAVKNEEQNIERTIDHCLSSAYPKHLMELIVVDDGSTDETWKAMVRAHKRHPQVRLFRFGKNKGKRHAMALGAVKAKGEVLVYVDSDSFLDPESLYNIVQPLKDPSIGAVAGNIQVIVNPRQILSKMESVRYFISHRVIKSCESIFGSVTCCSGAFSAYRRSAVLPILASWLNQTFMGTRSTFGDDRSLTNYILSSSRVVFHHGAVCWTYVPETWAKFFRQQLRWKKSWTRETLVAINIMWRKHPAAALSYYLGVIMTVISPLIAFRALVIMPMFAHTSCIPYVAGLVLVNFFFCLYFFYHTGAKHWLHGLGFAFLYVSALCWINYYAMITVNRTHWGTR